MVRGNVDKNYQSMKGGVENEIREYVHKGGGYFWARDTDVPGLCSACTKETVTLIQEHPREPWKYACDACMPSQRLIPINWPYAQAGWIPV